MFIQLKNISKSFGKQCIFHESNLTIEDNGLYFIRGKSGSGKTTLLNLIRGYENIDAGERNIDKDITFSMLFQNFGLLDDFSVKENIYLYEQLYEYHNEHDQMILSTLGIDSLLDHYPSELSHGQKQRVALARTLMNHADVYLCDEPAESLDKNNRVIVMDLLKKLAQDCIVIIVSHDENLIASYYDVVYQIENHQIVFEKQRNKRIKHQIQAKPTYSHQAVDRLMNQFARKRKMMFVLFISILIFICTYFSKAYIGYDTSMIGTLDDHVIYRWVDTFGYKPIMKGNPELYRKHYDVKDELYIEDHTLNVSLYAKPAYEKQVELIEGDLQQEGIIVNQYVAKDLKKLLGKDNIIKEQVSIVFQMGAYSCDFELPISATIVEDEELKVLHAYYPYDVITTYLEDNELMELYEEDYVKQYDVHYALDTDMNAVYQEMEEAHYNGHNEVLDMSKFHLYQKDMIRFIFLCISVLLVLVTTLFLVLYLNFQGKQKARDLMLVHSMVIPMEILYRSYQKASSRMFGEILVGALLIELVCNGFLNELFRAAINIRIENTYSVVVSIVVFVYYLLVYRVSQFIMQTRWKTESVSNLLKENG